LGNGRNEEAEYRIPRRDPHAARKARTLLLLYSLECVEGEFSEVQGFACP
jgi:hypothetical protein